MCAILTVKWKLSHQAKDHHPFNFFLSVHDVFIARNDCYYEQYRHNTCWFVRKHE